MPEDMQAVVIHEHGPRENMVLEKLPRPEARSGEVLVNIKAAGVNHLDVHTRRGLPGVHLEMPHVLGSDGAGVVAAVGDGVTGVEVGQRVALNPMTWDGVCEFCLDGEQSLCVRLALLGEHMPGTYCQYRSVPARNILPLPDDVSFEKAAAGVLVYQTAWRMTQRVGLTAGQSVLVLGASGGVGSACLDIARFLGAHVYAVVGSAEKAEQALRLGAHHAIDYTSTDFAKEVRAMTGKRGVDVALDSVGGDTYVGAVKALRKGGRYVTCGATAGNGPPAQLHRVFWNQLDIMGSTMANERQTREVTRLLWEGKLNPVIDSVLPLGDAQEAHRKLEERDHFGKVILKVE